MLSHTRDRDDPILEAVEIDLHCYRSACSRRGRIGIVASATASAAGRSGTDALIFIALRKHGTRLAFFENGQIQTEIFVVIVGGHVEPLRFQTEIGGGEKPEIFSAGIPDGPD